MSLTPICNIQGTGIYSPIAGRTVTSQGVVTGVVRRGFFLQSVEPSKCFETSDGIFVYSPEWSPSIHSLIEITGEVVDYIKDDNSKPVTQIRFDKVKLINEQAPYIMPFMLMQAELPSDPFELAEYLNCLEGMLVGISAGQTFISPSNPYGDYVLALDHPEKLKDVVRNSQNGCLLDHDNPSRWFPGFRITDYTNAPRINVGATLLSDVVGPLNYRVEAYQIAATGKFKYNQAYYPLKKAEIQASKAALTVLTLNCFNLDPHIESPDLVMNPKQDVDDNWGDGRFHTLAQAVVLQANLPDIVALQEIQDSDGAEMTEQVNAEKTYSALVKTIKQLSGIKYKWVDIEPEAGADGGQPGGNIRNGYLYNPSRVEIVTSSVSVFAEKEACYVGSRKPLIAHFKEKASSKVLAVINLHLASKRHQSSIFAPEKPGFDGKLPVRVDQANKVREKILELREQGINYYVTGDFNDTEKSHTLLSMCGDESTNLVNLLPIEERYDYNHRGKLQVLMHGIVAKELVESNKAEYEIIHGNELLGVKPGEKNDKPSDHAYVLAKISLT